MSDNGDNSATVNAAAEQEPTARANDQLQLSIDDVNPDNRYEQSFTEILSSPRTLEACRRQGINLADLDPVSEERVRKILSERRGETRRNILPQVLVEIRMKHYEDRRRELFRLIKEERYMIMDEAEQGSKFLGAGVSRGGSVQGSSQMVSARNPNKSQSPETSMAFANHANGGNSAHLSERPVYGRQPGKFITTASSFLPHQQSKSPSLTPSVNMMSNQNTNLFFPGAGAGQSSSMIEKEKRAIEKIKARQRKEVEQMMDYELQLERIRQQNEEKMIKQREREERRRQEILRSQQEQEERKLQEEERKRLKAEEELMEQRRRAEEQNRKDQEQIAKQRELELQRKKEAAIRDEIRRKQQEEFQAQTERILHEQQQEVERRKIEMERRDQERREFQAKVQIERQRAATQKRLQAEAKIESAKSVAEQALQIQRKEFEKREKLVEEKRKQFEESRERERQEVGLRSLQKAEEMKKIMQQSLINAEARKSMILRAQEIAEQRQLQLAREREKSLEAKRKIMIEKELHSIEVRKIMDRQQQERVSSITSQARRKEEIMARTANERDWQMMIKKEQELLKREEKQTNVERISRAQEYKKKLILDKIEYDNSKTESLKIEKEQLFSSRATIRREADKQKQKIMETFEKMRRKGRLDRSALIQFGVSFPEPVKEDPANEGEINDDADLGITRNIAARRGSALESQMNPIDVEGLM